MFRFIFILFTIIFFMSANDVTLEISKKSSKINPTINIEVSKNDKLSRSSYRIMIKDLNVLGYFDVVDKYSSNSFTNSPLIKSKKYNYTLMYKISSAGGSTKLVAKLYESGIVKPILQKDYSIDNSKQYVFLLHSLAVDINKYFKLPDVSWMKRLVVFSKSISRMNSHIVISDYTLTYQKTIVTGSLNIFPKWASSKQEAIYYSNFSKKLPRLYRLDIKTGRKKFIVKSEGMLAVSDVSSSGKNVLVTMAPTGYSNVFLYKRYNNKLIKLTNSKYMNVNGNFIDDGNSIVYVSDMLGYPNIFRKDITTGKVKRLVFYGKNNNSMTAYKNYIVYSSRESDSAFRGNIFNLHLMSTKTNIIRRLTSSGKNLFPRFSSNGNTILYIKKYRGGYSALGLIRLNYNRSFIFPLKSGESIQSIDW